MPQVVDLNAPCSLLEQRLEYARRFIREPVILSSNTPQWLETEFDIFHSELASVDSYPATQGVPELIESICHRENTKYRLNLQPTEVLVTNGALHGLSLIFRSLYRPGAIALCQAPVFSGIANVLHNSGYKISFFSCADNHIDIINLQREVTENIQLIFINLPNNPTGQILSEDSIRNLLSFAETHQINLIADLVYDDFIFYKNKLPQPLSFQSDWHNLYVVNSISKNFGAPGLRVGWIISNLDNIKSLSGRLESECIAVCSPAQRQAYYLMKRGNKSLIERVNKNREIVEASLSRLSSVTFQEPEGGTHYFIKLPVKNIEDFADFMLVKFGLVMVTSGNYAECPGNYIRIPLGCSITTILHSLDLINLGVQKWNEMLHS